MSRDSLPRTLRVLMALITAVSVTIVSCAPPSGTNPPPTHTDLLINTPHDGAHVAAPFFFGLQALDPGKIQGVAYSANGEPLEVDAAGENTFRVFVIPGDYPQAEIELEATVTRSNGQTTTLSVTVHNDSDPPSSTTVGSDGAVLGDEEDNGATSTLTIPPGVATGADVTFGTRSQAQVKTETGVDYGALGVTFLGAQEIDSDREIDGPVGISSGGFGPLVQPGQAVVNYTIGPDADGDGIGELIVINSATVAPNGDLISDPVPGVLTGSGLVSGASGSSSFRTMQAGLRGMPGATIEFETSGLNPYSVLGNEARFESLVDGTVIAVPLWIVPDPETGEKQIASTTIPPLPAGAAELTVTNVSTGAEVGPFDVTIETLPALTRPAEDIIDERLAELAARARADLPEEIAERTASAFDEMRAVVAETASSPSAQEAELLTTMAQMLVVAADSGASSLRTQLKCDPSGTDGLVAASMGIGSVGIGVATVAEGGLAIGLASGGIALLAVGLVYFAGRAFGAWLVDGVAPAHACPVPPPPCPPTAAGGILAFTGMGSVVPSGGPACGSVGPSTLGGSALRTSSGLSILDPGAYSVKVFVNGTPVAFSGRTDQSGYFMIPFIAEGQTFTAVATEFASGDTQAVEGVGAPVGMSQFLFFDFSDAVAATEVNWDGGGDGASWNDPLNWAGDTLPGATDRAVIDQTGDLTVTLDGGSHTLAGLRLGNDLAIGAGSLAIDGPWTIESSGSLTLTGGTLTGFGALTNGGDFTWSGGNYSSDADVRNDGTMTIAVASGSAFWRGRAVTNSGTFAVANDIDMPTINGAVALIDNLAGGVIDIRTDRLFGVSLPGSTMTLRNLGSVIKSAGAGSGRLGAVFENLGGSVEARSGTLNLERGGRLEGGTYHADAGATLSFGHGTFEILGTLSGTPAGAVRLAGTGASLVVPAGESAVFDFGAQGFEWDRGPIDGPGTLRNEGLFRIVGASNKGLAASAVFENAGTVRHEVGSLFHAAGSRIENLSGALYDVTGDLYASGGTFVNTGTVRKSAGDGAGRLGSVFENLGGSVEVQTGRLEFEEGGSLDGGSYEADAGSSLAFTSGVFEVMGVLQGDTVGAVQLAGTGASLVVPVGESAVFDFGGQGFEWDRGPIDGPGTLRNEGLFRIVGASNKGLAASAVFENAGTVRHEVGSLFHIVGSRIENLSGALYDVTGDLYASGGTFVNTGTVRKSAGDGAGRLGSVFENLGGSVEVQDGRLEFEGGGSLDGGSYEADAGSSLAFTSGVFEVMGVLQGDTVGAVQLAGTGASLVVPVGESAVFDFGGQGFEWDRGPIDGPGTLRNEGLFRIVGASNKGLAASAVFENAGTVRHEVGSLFHIAGSRIENLSGALYDVAGDLNTFGGTFANAGTLRKSAGAGTATWNVCFLEEGGTVEQLSGTLTIDDSCP